MEFDKAYFDAGLERRGTDCMKWDGMMEEHHDPDMVPMWVADMDFPSAPAIREAVQKVVDQGTWGYTMSGEADACALRDYWKRRHGVSFEPKDVLMGSITGSGNSIDSRITGCCSSQIVSPVVVNLNPIAAAISPE